jgi:inorganic pyrophosphatase
MSSKKKTLKASVANPSLLDSLDQEAANLQVVIETPKGSRNKYAFDEKQRVFGLKKVFPAGMEFPYDFGFVPSTLAGDGDPTDVLVLMDEPAFPGCVLQCRIIGIIEGVQGKKKKLERNDRLWLSTKKIIALRIFITSRIWAKPFCRNWKISSSTITN